MIWEGGGQKTEKWDIKKQSFFLVFFYFLPKKTIKFFQFSLKSLKKHK